MLEEITLYKAVIKTIGFHIEWIELYDEFGGLQRTFLNIPQYKDIFDQAVQWVLNHIRNYPDAYRVEVTGWGYVVQSNSDLLEMDEFMRRIAY